ncbi:hypothetical protein NIES970_03300 [[Synechococcus] sp. NIES-970]|nr:hypothetical protein NIES970_03300 [[Synechococcus] sp. NIES-970]
MTPENMGTERLLPQQIVCLAAGDRRLYSAVIQYIEPQGNYWIRPLCLVNGSPSPIPLHRTADIIVPADQVRAVFDTEILNYWTALYDDSGKYDDNFLGRQLLQDFLHSLDWSGEKSAFGDSL